MDTHCRMHRTLLPLFLAVIALAGSDVYAACQSGAAGDSQLLEAVRTARANGQVLAGNEAAVKTAQESIFATCPCSPQGQQYKELQLTYLDGLAAAAACQAIVKSNPTISGTNQYLTCIGPVNAALIATAAQIRDIEFSVISSRCTVTANAASVATPHFNVFSAWAQSLKFVYDIKSAGKLLGLARSVPEVVRGTRAWPIAESARFHIENPSFGNVLNASSATEVSAIRKLIQMPSTIQELIASPSSSGSTLIIGADPAIAPLFRRPGLPTFPLPAAAAPERAAARSAAPPRVQLAEADAATASDLALVSVPADSFVSLGFAPLWLPPFLQSYERSRLAQAQSVHALLGLTTPAADAPQAGAGVGSRIPASEDMQADKIAALNAVLEQNDALAANLEQFVRLAANGQDMPALRRSAATIARLAVDEPALRHRAYTLVTPAEGAAVVEVLSSPWYLNFDFARVLLDPALDRSMAEASNAFAAIAGVDAMMPQAPEAAAPPTTGNPTPADTGSPLAQQQTDSSDSGGGGCSPFHRTSVQEPDVTLSLLAMLALLTAVRRHRRRLDPRRP